MCARPCQWDRALHSTIETATIIIIFLKVRVLSWFWHKSAAKCDGNSFNTIYFSMIHKWSIKQNDLFYVCSGLHLNFNHQLMPQCLQKLTHCISIGILPQSVTFHIFSVFTTNCKVLNLKLNEAESIHAESTQKGLRSLLYLCYTFQALINSLCVDSAKF